MLTLEQLLTDQREHVIFESVVGSRAYGTSLPDSDEDIKGVFAVPAPQYLQLQSPLPQLSDGKGDTVFYSLRRFLELAATANPNIIELLFMPAECVRYKSAPFELIEAKREIFLTKAVYDSHIGYAQAQIKKARGQNKWINNPQPEERPQLENFCWFLAREGECENEFPLRPKPLRDVPVSLTECHVSALEHCPGMYRIYHIGPDARGVIRGGKVVCESISPEQERSRCLGLLSVNLQAYERACNDHKQYWEWRTHRNEARWKAQESGDIDYDAKNMMHTFRLLISGESILKNGFPIVRFEGDQLSFLMDVRNGKFLYQELMDLVEQRVNSLEKIRKQSDLIETPDFGAIESLLAEGTQLWMKQAGKS